MRKHLLLIGRRCRQPEVSNLELGIWGGKGLVGLWRRVCGSIGGAVLSRERVDAVGDYSGQAQGVKTAQPQGYEWLGFPSTGALL